MAKVNLVHLSKTISHALRHAPWLYELELDEEGWAPVEQLLEGLHRHRRTFRDLSQKDLEAMLARPGKRRFEMRDGRIRALYGHSIEMKIYKKPAAPPPALYHGTAPHAAQIIRRDGLKPMNRQYVHLSTDRDTAQEVGRRKAPKPVVLTVRARDAHDAGLPFYKGIETIWLADYIPPEYVA